MQECRSSLYKYLYEKLQVMKTIVVLVDGIFYWVNEAENTDKTNFFRYYEKTLGIYKGAALQDLESRFLENFSGGIDSIVKSSLASMPDEKKKKLLEKQESLLSLGDNAYLAERVVKEMIPIFQRKSHQKKNCSKDVSKTPYKNLLMENRFQDCKKQDVLSELSGIIYSLFGNGPMFFYGGMRYNLARGDFPKRKNVFFYADGAIYNAGEGEKFDIEKIDEIYHSKIREAIKSKILNSDKAFAKQLENISKESDILRMLAKKEYIDPSKKVGFIITPKGFHALAVVEDSYIFYDPHNKQYYGFGPEFGKKPATIVVRLERDGGNIKVQKPRVLNKYKHPSLHDESGYREICTGEYTPPNTVTLEQLPSKIAAILSETIDIFTEGYSGSSEWKMFYKDKPYWTDHLLSGSQFNQNMANGLFIKKGA